VLFAFVYQLAGVLAISFSESRYFNALRLRKYICGGDDVLASGWNMASGEA
jgi:hypothetical protein